MARLTRLFHYGSRLLLDPQYRNRVLTLVDRHATGAAHESLAEDLDPERARFLAGRRIFIIAGCEMTFVGEYLDHLGAHTCHTLANGRGTDPMTEVVMPGSRALSEPWDCFLLSVSQVLRQVIHAAQTTHDPDTRARLASDLDNVLDNYRVAIREIRRKSTSPIVIFSFLLRYSPTFGLHEYRTITDGSSLIELWHLYHLRLYALARESPGVYVLDADVALEETSKRDAVDLPNSSGTYFHPTRAGAQRIGMHFVRLLGMLEPDRRIVKCAVFDLDGTLWDGVLREDGATGVSVNEYYIDVMELLAARGILLAVCSKNDPIEAGQLPGLIGAKVHAKIVSTRLGWGPKSQALKAIADELNIGLDSLAFFDDSPFERAEVAANAPEVLVLTPEQLVLTPNMMEFQPAGAISDEALSRTRKYQDQARRKQVERSSENLDTFLRHCEMQLELRSPADGEMSRVSELLQRTDQFNATLGRTLEGRLPDYVAEPQRYLMRVARLADRFGDYGLVGFCLVDRCSAVWRILELAFSCRSAGRGVEQSLLSHICNVAEAQAAHSVLVHFKPGPRNQRMLEILRECEFSGDDEPDATPDLALRLDRRLRTAPIQPFPAWLSVQVGA